jgi:hypothetical protein
LSGFFTTVKDRDFSNGKAESVCAIKTAAGRSGPGWLCRTPQAQQDSLNFLPYLKKRRLPALFYCVAIRILSVRGLNSIVGGRWDIRVPCDVIWVVFF